MGFTLPRVQGCDNCFSPLSLIRSLSSEMVTFISLPHDCLTNVE
jgi:hypothetical protein